MKVRDLHFGVMSTSGQRDLGIGHDTAWGPMNPLCGATILDGKQQLSPQVEYVTCRACCLALLPALIGQMNAVVATLIGLDNKTQSRVVKE